MELFIGLRFHVSNSVFGQGVELRQVMKPIIFYFRMHPYRRMLLASNSLRKYDHLIKHTPCHAEFHQLKFVVLPYLASPP